MNPLDNQEIPFIIRNIEKEMPKHMPTTVEIPHTFGNMPKDLKDYSNKVMDKYLNNHLHVIEEIAHRYPNHDLPKWMKKYARQYYLQAGILAHDSFFKASFESRLKFRQHTNPFIEFGGKVNGAQLDYGADTSNTNYSDGSGAIRAGKATGGIVTQYYNEIAFHTASVTAGNMSLGAYQDSSGTPAAKYADTGTFTNASNDFTFHSLTEFALLQTSVWLAWQVANSSSFAFWYGAAAQAIYQNTEAYTVPMTDPFGGGSGSTYSWHLKLAHT